MRKKTACPFIFGGIFISGGFAAFDILARDQGSFHIM